MITFKFKKEEEKFRMEEFKMAIEPKNKRPTRRPTQKKSDKKPIQWIENFKLRHDVFMDMNEDDDEFIKKREEKFFELAERFIAKQNGKINDLWFKIAFPQTGMFAIYYKNKNMKTGYHFANVDATNLYLSYRKEGAPCLCVSILAKNKNQSYPDGFDVNAFNESKKQITELFFDMFDYDDRLICYDERFSGGNSGSFLAVALDYSNIDFSLAAYAILHAKDIYVNIDLTTYGAAVRTAREFSDKDELWIKSKVEYSFYI